MKKIITLFAIFLIILIFNGCDDKDKKNDINVSSNIVDSNKIKIKDTNQIEENKASIIAVGVVEKGIEKGIERGTSNIIVRIGVWIGTLLWNIIANIFIFLWNIIIWFFASLWSIIIWIFAYIWAIPFVPEILIGLIGLLILFGIGEAF